MIDAFTTIQIQQLFDFHTQLVSYA